MATAQHPEAAATDQMADRHYYASQYRLMWLKLKKHHLAIFGAIILGIMYFIAVFAEFLAPYTPQMRSVDFLNAPPQLVRFVGPDGFSFRPFVYAYTLEEDPITWRRVYKPDTANPRPLRFFTQGPTYRMWGIFDSDLHLFGVAEGRVFLFGTDSLGRDLLSRVIYGARISLSVGLVGIVVSFVIGLVLGGVSGYFGGRIDMLIQRLIEFLRSIPVLPLWLTLSAALPRTWSPLAVYFGITLILSVIGWTGLARVVRGKLLSLREEDFVVAARISGARPGYIIANHLIPSFLSYIIVSLTLAIPRMILAETALSFLGVGLRPPVVSWGVLLNDAQNIHAVALAPWLMIPGAFIVITVLAFSFVGDGMRDAADPYS